MSKKPKFNPEITRVKLNPEQAVLTCTCFDANKRQGGTHGNVVQVCLIGLREWGNDLKTAEVGAS